MVMTKNYVNMAFRNHKFSPSVPATQSVVEQSLKTTVVDGVDIFTRVDVDASSKPPLPSADDYRLSALLASGSPLNYVNPLVFDNPELDAAHFVDTNLVDVPPVSAPEPASVPAPEPSPEPSPEP